MTNPREHTPHETSAVVAYRAARVIDPSQGIDGPATVVVEGGRVARVIQGSIRKGELPRGARVVELAGSEVLTPGFVDLHVHLREPGYTAKETIASGAHAAARGGFTSVCCMPNTQPVLDNPSALALVRERSRGGSARVYPIAAITKGEQGQELAAMGTLAAAGAVAFSDDGAPVANSKLARSALEYAAPLGLPVVEHCQDPELVGAGVMHEGAYSTLLGLPGWPAAGEEIMLARDLMLVRATGARYHAAHLSTAGSVALMRAAKAEGLSVTAEVTPHHLLLTDAWVAGERTGPLADALREMGLDVPPGEHYDTDTKVNPPLRTAADCVALLEGLIDGTIDAIATDHAPHTIVDKDTEYALAAFGISGLETALAGLLALVHTGRLPLATLIAALTVRPAQAFGLPGGTLAVGAPADLTVFDPDEEWTVDPARFASLGKNTPLAGLRLRGRVRLTLLGGETVYDAAREAEEARSHGGA